MGMANRVEGCVIWGLSRRQDPLLERVGVGRRAPPGFLVGTSGWVLAVPPTRVLGKVRFGVEGG